MAIPCKLDPIGLFGLPSNYVRLKYLRSDGYQYIDTLYKATLNTAIQVQFTPANVIFRAVAGMRTDLTSANIVIYIGNQSSTANFLTDFNYRNNSRHYAFVPDFNNVYNTLLYDAYLDRFNSNVNVYKDGEPYFEASHSYNVDYFDDSKSANVALFSNNVSMGNSGGGFIGKIYGCKIKNGDIVVRNFIPALAPHDKDRNPTPQGTPCMFDMVTHAPFFNNGESDFLYELAPEVHVEIPVEEAI